MRELRNATRTKREVCCIAIRRASFALQIAALSFASATASEATPGDEAGLDFYERRVRPVLVEHCYKCHSESAESVKGGLRLDSAAGIHGGGDSGEIVVPGRPGESPLLDAVNYVGEFYDMPPGGRLPDRAIADIRRWIEIGAPLPAEGAPAPQTVVEAIDIEQGRSFWSFQPAREAEPPSTADPAWPRTKIDYFVRHRLEESGLEPAPPADRRTLVRRVYFDLVGLPPTYEEVQSFVADESTDAYARLVDRLLASPQYGERWGRHWLDVARYGEDNPTSESTCKPPRFPYRYRDWVIQALNDDLPYDEFLRRQLAADLMEVEQSEIAALGFLGLSPVYHKEPKLSDDVISVIVADEWDERIDAVTRGLLGLTVACARCHDHKFDPITVEDYYALAGVMASTQLVEWPLVETNPDEAASLNEVQRQIVDTELRLSYAKTMRKTADETGEDPTPFEEAAKRLESTVEDMKAVELFDGPIANAVRDAALVVNGDDAAWTTLDYTPGAGRDLPVFLRGSVTNHGDIVPRRFLQVLSDGEPLPFGDGSGRLELAGAIVGDAGSLTARVIVNRAWGWHFGQPLVTTPSNFGALGDRPSHPELLDDLAARFIDHGWSLKWLHREIVLSSTYRQASRCSDSGADVDPDNRLLWRMNRRRLEVEAWRDAVLQVAGKLDGTMGGPSKSLADETNCRRTVYGTVSRQRPADVLRLFDFPDAKRHGDERILTTTPVQQLYLLNSPFIEQHAATLAKGVTDECGEDRQATVRALFHAVVLRDPTNEEQEAALALVARPEGDVTPEACNQAR